MNIIITGATGFVGTRLTKELLEKGHNVFALVRSERKEKMLYEKLPENLTQNLNILRGDISSALLGLSEGLCNELTSKIDTIYHVAAYLSFDDSERERTFQINVGGTNNVLEFAKRIKVQNFFHVSTAYTLGKKEFGKEELHSVDNEFVNNYEESKCHAEHLLTEYKDNFNISIFRPAIIVGDSKTGEAESNFALYGVLRSFSLLKKRIERNKELLEKKIKFMCNAHTNSNFVPVDYVTKVLVAGLTHAENGKIYHITNSNPPSHQVVFELMKEALNLNNVELVPVTYKGVLSKMDKFVNSAAQVFHPYMEKSVRFEDKNTKLLLERASVQPVVMDKEMLRNIIFAFSRPVRV
ncbi:SDR family oxidoreductase [Bacillus solimangrovi]|uniref:Short-chain dehydrogenase n=1 Tax=Bacillus solimangrovi TaxID=1305675 RepID=A0A1E5LHL2_9BACI|nr:SDR family oxidoreductase [Bacillus solimangrovi]OEH93557.1 short-chain dehydrogenase [Bacillus solimangrovi]